MWKWIAAVALALVVGFAFGRMVNMHHSNYGHRPTCYNGFSKLYKNYGMGPQCMGGSFNGYSMMGGCRNCQSMDMRGPNPGNTMPGGYGCPNRPGNDGNKYGHKCGHNKKDSHKMERKHRDDKDDNEDTGDDEDDD